MGRNFLILRWRGIDLSCRSTVINSRINSRSSGTPAVGHYCQGNRVISIGGSMRIIGRLEVEEISLQIFQISIKSKSSSWPQEK